MTFIKHDAPRLYIPRGTGEVFKVQWRNWFSLGPRCQYLVTSHLCKLKRLPPLNFYALSVLCCFASFQLLDPFLSSILRESQRYRWYPHILRNKGCPQTSQSLYMPSRGKSWASWSISSDALLQLTNVMLRITQMIPNAILDIVNMCIEAGW